MKKYDNFCKALANLKEGSKLEEPYTIVEQTGIVGLFEKIGRASCRERV